MGNTYTGVGIGEAANNTVGGTSAGQRNLISGNNEAGVELWGAGATGNRVLGNWIGLNASGATTLGNTWAGVWLNSGAAGNTIGGTAAGSGNMIAGQTAGDGIELRNDAGANNAILGNSIYSNSESGIDLIDNGITANDAGDADTGANNLQNFPVLTSANANAAGTTIAGTFDSNASTTYRIEFFANRPSVADAANGEGERYLGFSPVTTDGSGNATINTTLANVWVNSGDRITATATVDLGGGNYGSTSEFAANVTADLDRASSSSNTTSDTSDGTTTSITNLGNNRGADGRISLREAIAAANNTANGGTPDKIVFAIDGSGPHTINVGSALPTISQALIIDGSSEPDYVTNGNRPIVVLDGNGLAADGLVLSGTADGSAIRGLVIRDFGTTTSHDGIEIQAGSTNNTIAGNYIGRLTATGADVGAAEANTGQGINILGANNTIDGNVISGNWAGVLFSGSGASGNVVVRNLIGTDATGTVLIGNSSNGVDIGGGAPNNTIGGVGAGNVIVGSGNDGITIWGAGASGNKVQGNTIGTDPTGTLNWGNSGWGVIVTVGGTGNIIGGANPGEGNVIAFNNKDGVSIDDASAVNNSILGNSIYGDTDSGIDLGTAGVTANDANDADTGANNLQNFPVLTTVKTSGGNTLVVGSLNSTANTTFRIEFFSSPTGDGTGYGEGQTYLGAATVTTDSSGNASIATVLAGVSVTTGHAVSATATVDLGAGSYGSTSEFAQNITPATTNVAPIITNLASDRLDYTEGAIATPIDLNGNSSVIDVDSLDFNSGTLTVSFTAGSDSAEDVLGIRSQGTGAGQIGVSGSNVTYGGTTIGTLTGGSGGSNLVVTFNANSTPAAATALVQNITYQNTDTGAPTGGIRTVRFVLTDGDGGTSANYDTYVTVKGGMGVWANNNTTPEYAVWSGSAFGTDANSQAVGQWVIVETAEAPTRTEIIAVGMDAAGVIAGQMWNGSSWSALPFGNLVDLSVSSYWSFDVAYEQQSGRALLVWDNGTTGSASISYRVWDGAAWSSAQTITTPLSGEARQLRLAADPGSNELVLVATNSAKQSYALVWNGTSWGNSQILDNSATGADLYDASVAYESHSGDALVLFADPANARQLAYTHLGRRDVERRVDLVGRSNGDVRFTTLASDPTSDRIAVGVLSANNEVWFSVWDGSTWGSSITATTTAATNAAPAMAVAFESSNSQLLAVWGISGNNAVQYNTWSAAGGWGTAAAGPNVGAVPNALRLSPGSELRRHHAGLARRWPRRELHLLERFRLGRGDPRGPPIPGRRPACRWISSGKTTTARR